MSGFRAVPVGPETIVNGVVSQLMSDGTTITVDTGLSAVASVATAAKAALGATTGNGHTTAAITFSFATVAVGGTPFVITGVSDPSSGIAPGIGAKCAIGTSTITPLPLSLLFDCTVTAPGVVTVTALPRAGIALGAQSFTANVFWWW